MTGLVAVDAGLLLAARVFILLIFGRAALGKVRHFEEFVGVVAGYRLLPQRVVAAAAWMLSGLEAVVVLSFLTGYGLTQAACLAAGLLCLFALAMTINLARGRTAIDCGCFRGSLRQRISAAAVLRNLVLAGVAALSALAAPPSASGMQLVYGLCGGMTVFLMCLIGEQLAAVGRQGAFLRHRWS